MALLLLLAAALNDAGLRVEAVALDGGSRRPSLRGGAPPLPLLDGRAWPPCSAAMLAPVLRGDTLWMTTSTSWPTLTTSAGLRGGGDATSDTCTKQSRPPGSATTTPLSSTFCTCMPDMLSAWQQQNKASGGCEVRRHHPLDTQHVDPVLQASTALPACLQAAHDARCKRWL